MPYNKLYEHLVFEVKKDNYIMMTIIVFIVLMKVKLVLLTNKVKGNIILCIGYRCKTGINIIEACELRYIMYNCMLK